MTQTIPVILHTDLGTDMDDSWALLMMLRLRHLRPLQVLVDTGDVKARAALAARILETDGRMDLEIGLGVPDRDSRCPITVAEWMKDYSVQHYPGKIVADGIHRMIELILESPEPVTVISVSPPPALAEALRRAPEIAAKTNFVGMFGSVYRGYSGAPGACAEYNVFKDIPAAKTVLEAPWRSAKITPLDTCCLAQLNAEYYRRIAQATHPSLKALVDCYECWKKFYHCETEFKGISSRLYDTVAVYMVTEAKFLNFERLNISVTEEGLTRINPAGKPMEVALAWNDLDGYNRFVTGTMLGGTGVAVC